jgi:hypothetical protein
LWKCEICSKLVEVELSINNWGKRFSIVNVRFLNSICIECSEEDPLDFRDYVGRGENNFLCFNDRSGRIEKHEKLHCGKTGLDGMKMSELRRKFFRMAVGNSIWDGGTREWDRMSYYDHNQVIEKGSILVVRHWDKLEEDSLDFRDDFGICEENCFCFND